MSALAARPLRLVSRFWLSCCALVSSSGLLSAAEPGQLVVYFGTYTHGRSQGIYRSRLELATGRLAAVELAAATPSPSFLAVDPRGRFLFAVNEIDNYEGDRTGSVSSFRIDPAGGLTALNAQASGGAAPCHVVVHPSGTHVLVANYASGSVAALPVDGQGQLSRATSVVRHQGRSVNPQRQEAPHAHCIQLDGAGQFALAADLGLDQLLVYRFDIERGLLEAHDPPQAALAPGSGPRHLAFHPGGRYVYAINELRSTITGFAFDPVAGRLAELQTLSTLPRGFDGPSHTAEVVVHPSGKFVYGSNRGHDSIAVFQVDPASGRLAPRGHHRSGGQTPRNFCIDPSGRYLLAANQSSDSVVVFRIDAGTGELLPTGHAAAVPAPVCVKFLAAPQ
jgi:6-phosphogluconolactonase